MMEILSILAGGIGTTIWITALSFALGAVLAVPLVLLRRSSSRMLRWGAVAIVEFIRSIPPIVWLFIIYYVIGAEILRLETVDAAVLGFGIISAAYLSEVYRAALAAVPTGQWEAAKALGLAPIKSYLKVIMPQALILVVPPAATYMIGLLKDTAVASVIGSTDITFLAFQTSRLTGQGLTVFLIAAALYLLLSVPIAVLARVSGQWVERKLAVA